jgi:hypothetical protein
MDGLGLWCLMPLSTIFLLYWGGSQSPWSLWFVVIFFNLKILWFMILEGMLFFLFVENTS